MSSVLYAASPEPIVVDTDSLGVAVVFDTNLITKFRSAPRHQGSELGGLLRFIQGEGSAGSLVSILPAIAESNYRTAGSSSELILSKNSQWVAEHFAPFGVHEVLQSGKHLRQDYSSSLLEILGRVSLHYWALCAGRRAFRRFPKLNQRASALGAFFDEIIGAGSDGAGSTFFALTIGSALCGNDDARDSLNLADESPKALMNGSWDLYFWHSVVQLWLASPKTLLHPTLFSEDKNAVRLFTRLVPAGEDSINFTFGSDKKPLDEKAVEQLASRIQDMPRGSSVNVDWVARAEHLVPVKDRCPDFDALLARLKELPVE